MIESIATIGKQLKAIRDEKVYKHDYPSFEAYCMDRWKMSRPRAYQLISAENTRALLADATQGNEEMSKIVDAMPEAQLREISKVPAENRIEVIAEAVAAGPVSGGKLKKLAQTKGLIPASKLPSPKPKEKVICPHCGKNF